jgi:hypothetical protein
MGVQSRQNVAETKCPLAKRWYTQLGGHWTFHERTFRSKQNLTNFTSNDASSARQILRKEYEK